MSTVINVTRDTEGINLQTIGAKGAVRVLVAIDVTAEQAADRSDLMESVYARLADEAGYLGGGGEPITPVNLVVTLTDDTDDLTPRTLAGAYAVGIEGAEEWTP